MCVYNWNQKYLVSPRVTSSNKSDTSLLLCKSNLYTHVCVCVWRIWGLAGVGVSTPLASLRCIVVVGLCLAQVLGKIASSEDGLVRGRWDSLTTKITSSDASVIISSCL